MLKLQRHGWPVGLRFDPLIYQKNYQSQYRQLFEQIFSVLDLDFLHSVSLGAFRLPEKYFKKIHKLYPQERLFAAPLSTHKGMVTYRAPLEQEMLHYCSQLLLNFIPEQKFFPCQI